MYAPGPPLGTYTLRVPASRAGYVPDAQGGLPPGPHVLYVRGTRTSLGRLVRTAYRGNPGAMRRAAPSARACAVRLARRSSCCAGHGTLPGGRSRWCRLTTRSPALLPPRARSSERLAARRTAPLPALFDTIESYYTGAVHGSAAAGWGCAAARCVIPTPRDTRPAAGARSRRRARARGVASALALLYPLSAGAGGRRAAGAKCAKRAEPALTSEG